MNRLITWILVILFTFTVGLASVKLLVVQQYISSQPDKVIVQNIADPEPVASQPITFKALPFTEMYQDAYQASDGVFLWYGCFERESQSKVLEEMRKKRFGSQLIGRTNVLNNKTEKVGERMIWNISDKTFTEVIFTEVIIKWSVGKRIFIIHAPSINYAQAFEKSNVWADQPCINFHRRHYRSNQ